MSGVRDKVAVRLIGEIGDVRKFLSSKVLISVCRHRYPTVLKKELEGKQKKVAKIAD